MDKKSFNELFGSEGKLLDFFYALTVYVRPFEYKSEYSEPGDIEVFFPGCYACATLEDWQRMGRYLERELNYMLSDGSGKKTVEVRVDKFSFSGGILHEFGHMFRGMPYLVPGDPCSAVALSEVASDLLKGLSGVAYERLQELSVDPESVELDRDYEPDSFELD